MSGSPLRIINVLLHAHFHGNAKVTVLNPIANFGARNVAIEEITEREKTMRTQKSHTVMEMNV